MAGPFEFLRRKFMYPLQKVCAYKRTSGSHNNQITGSRKQGSWKRDEPFVLNGKLRAEPIIQQQLVRSVSVHSVHKPWKLNDIPAHLIHTTSWAFHILLTNKTLLTRDAAITNSAIADLSSEPQRGSQDPHKACQVSCNLSIPSRLSWKRQPVITFTNNTHIQKVLKRNRCSYIPLQERKRAKCHKHKCTSTICADLKVRVNRSSEREGLRVGVFHHHLRR